MSNVVYTILIVISIFLVLWARQASTKGMKFTDSALSDFADELRRELVRLAKGPGDVVDAHDYLQGQPYYRSVWAARVFQKLYRDGTLLVRPRSRETLFSVSAAAIARVRKERLVAATDEPRNVTHIQAGFVQLGDHNTARDVTANYTAAGNEQLLDQLMAALATVAANPTLQPNLREAARQGADDLQQATTGDPSRLPVILERIRGIVSVAATGFEAVRPILEALLR